MRRETILAAFRVPLRPSERGFAAFSNTALHGFVCYGPQAAAMVLGRRFTSSVLLLFYLGRLANAIAAALLLGLAVRTAPLARPVFFLVGLLPMAVFLAGSISADAMTNGLAFVLTAFALACAFGHRAKVQGRDLAVLVLLSILLALTKPGYLLLSGLVFLIPGERFGSRRGAWAARLLVVSATLVAAVCWAMVLRSRGVVGSPDAGPAGFTGAGAAEVALRMLSDYARRAPALAVQFVGKLGWADVSLPIGVVAVHGVVVLFVALTCGRNAPGLRARDRSILAAVALTTALIVAAPFYFRLRPPGPEGAAAHHPQGRYLLPLGPIGFLLLSNRRWTLDWDARLGALAAWAAFVLGVALVSVAVRYYL